MKDFLKFTLATVTGIVISSVVLFFISILVVFSMVSSSESETQVRKNSVMMLDLNGTLVERSQENPLDLIMKDDYKTYGLDDILSSIKKAKENEDIKGIYIQATSLGAGFASLEEIRNALKDFKESGKFVVAYGDAYTQGLYYLSSVADKVLLNPQGMLEWRGLAATPMFFKDLLEKVGVEMQVFKVGTYKSAVEPFISTEMSAANREQINVYLSSIWGQITNAVAESRNLSVEALNKEADRMLMFYPAEESVKNGLVDTLIYKNDVRDYLKNLAGIDKDDNMPILGIQDMINVKKNVPRDKSGNVIAVYYAYGEIDGGSSASTDEGINSEKVIKDLRKLKDNENVKAVVLRVNSPGGSAYGSEQIWYAVNQLKKEKPVIVSMGDYAASGGYYISCNADTIVAEPTTLTGSIGIFGMMPNAKGLTEKLGVNFDVVKTNPYADFGNLTRPMNDDGTHQVAHIGGLATGGIYAYSHFAEFGKQFVRTVDDGGNHFSGHKQLVASDGARYQDIVHSTYTEQVVDVHNQRILCDAFPDGKVACLFPVHVGQAGFCSCAVCVHDITILRVTAQDIGDDFAESLREYTFVDVLNGVVHIFFGCADASHHISLITHGIISLFN